MSSPDRDLASLDTLTRRQREALWTWTWLGWRESTPAFKGSLALATAALIGLVAMYAAVR